MIRRRWRLAFARMRAEIAENKLATEVARERARVARERLENLRTK